MVPAFSDLVRPDEYPLSSRYDPAWLVGLDMGPNPLWLLEDLLHDLDLHPGMRVLDLGSGLGATSVFLARECDVEVVAADLWVSPEDVGPVLAQAGVGDRVQAVRADATALPFALGSLDAVVSIDAFEYFGTSPDYLPYLVRFLKPGGQVGIATAALTREIELGEIPAHIEACVGDDAGAWHTPEWWREHWGSTDLVSVHSARHKANMWHDWVLWTKVCLEHGGAADYEYERVLEMLEVDRGELLSFALVTARKV